jgi:hypothetical protein
MLEPWSPLIHFLYHDFLWFNHISNRV